MTNIKKHIEIMTLSKHSAKNLAVIENFILHLTHCEDEKEPNFTLPQTYTPEELYRVAYDYIIEDHVDGEGYKEQYLKNTIQQGEFVNDGIQYQIYDYVLRPFNDDEGFTNIEVIDYDDNIVYEIAGVEMIDEDSEPQDILEFEEVVKVCLVGEGLI